MPTHGGELQAERRPSFPTLASDYRVLEEIGQGVSAIVYTALCIPLNEVVAVKALDLEKCNSSLEDIRKEAQMLSMINHPNLLRAHCSFVKDQYLWVVMPFMAGGSCLHIMKSHFPDGLDEPTIATILKETLKGLDYLHRHGHIHRDVKAGNILVDAVGNVKLADFGVSAYMFDTGDRQRARMTFVGTPCWMAPEVLEQLHGYDFKADIWSFGITALELAHGHAPFSKFPPMKVLLMTLQSAPPSLEQDKEKRFSKAFKEMIAMCLVKDPSKRPTAEKLLKHSFFKQAKSADFVAKQMLEGLPPLGERVQRLKAKDEARMAAKKATMNSQEEKSQMEYKRSVSGWNFNVEDLKKQASMIKDDHDGPASIPEDKEGEREAREREERTSQVSASSTTSSSAVAPSSRRESEEEVGSGVIGGGGGNEHLTQRGGGAEGEAETSREGGSAATADGSVPSRGSTPEPLEAPEGTKKSGLITLAQPAGQGRPGTPTNVAKTSAAATASAAARKESKHIGRFQVFEGDQEEEGEGEGGGGKAGKGSPADSSEREGGGGGQGYTPSGGAGRRASDEGGGGQEAGGSRAGRGLYKDVGGSFNLSRTPRQSNAEEGSTHKSGPVLSTAPSAAGAGLSGDLEGGPAAGGAGGKEGGDERQRQGGGGGGAYQRKGRFSVTTDDGESGEDAVPSQQGQPTSMRRLAMPGSQPGSAPGSQPATPSSATAGAGLPFPPSASGASTSSASSLVPPSHVPLSAILPHVQTLMRHVSEQQEVVYNLMTCLSPPDAARTASGLKGPTSSRGSFASGEFGGEASDRERDMMQQLAEMQSKVALLQEELSQVKSKNSQLERQLNVFYNKEEEERIRKEEADKEDG